MSRSGFATIIQFTSEPCAAVNGCQYNGLVAVSDGIETYCQGLIKRERSEKEVRTKSCKWFSFFNSLKVSRQKSSNIHKTYFHTTSETRNVGHKPNTCEQNSKDFIFNCCSMTDKISVKPLVQRDVASILKLVHSIVRYT